MNSSKECPKTARSWEFAEYSERAISWLNLSITTNISVSKQQKIRHPELKVSNIDLVLRNATRILLGGLKNGKFLWRHFDDLFSVM